MLLCSWFGALPDVPNAPGSCVWGRPAYLIAAAALTAAAMTLAACADLRLLWLVAPLSGFAYGARTVCASLSAPRVTSAPQRPSGLCRIYEGCCVCPRSSGRLLS